MTIPSEQLLSWAKPAPSEKSKQTVRIFKEMIEEEFGNSIDVYLQGSYANHTNIKTESDVDIVVCFKGSSNKYLNQLIDTNLAIATQPQQNLFELRDILFSKLQNKNKFQFRKGSKTVKYLGNQNYLAADIVPCMEYDNGIAIYDHESAKIYVNYPKKHKENGEFKNKLTNGNYKAAVRMFKRAKEYMVNKGILKNASIAPSYFIESLIYNVPNSLFKYDYEQIFYNILDWLCNNKNSLSTFKCVNEEHYIFKQNSNNYNSSNYWYHCWLVKEAQKFINALVDL